MVQDRGILIRNTRSRLSRMSVHVRPESVFTLVQNTQRYLRELELCKPAESAITPATALVDNFNRFLLYDRGLAVSTVSNYCSNARDFLAYHFGTCSDAQ